MQQNSLTVLRFRQYRKVAEIFWNILTKLFQPENDFIFFLFYLHFLPLFKFFRFLIHCMSCLFLSLFLTSFIHIFPSLALCLLPSFFSSRSQYYENILVLKLRGHRRQLYNLHTLCFFTNTLNIVSNLTKSISWKKRNGRVLLALSSNKKKKLEKLLKVVVLKNWEDGRYPEHQP